MTDPRQAAIELMTYAACEHHTEITGEGTDESPEVVVGIRVEMKRVLDALLSDEGRPLLFKMMFDTDSLAVDDFERLTVEYLRERGVLVPPSEFTYTDWEEADTYAVRLPSEEDAK